MGLPSSSSICGNSLLKTPAGPETSFAQTRSARGVLVIVLNEIGTWLVQDSVNENALTLIGSSSQNCHPSKFCSLLQLDPGQQSYIAEICSPSLSTHESPES